MLFFPRSDGNVVSSFVEIPFEVRWFGQSAIAGLCRGTEIKKSSKEEDPLATEPESDINVGAPDRTI